MIYVKLGSKIRQTTGMFEVVVSMDNNIKNPLLVVTCLEPIQTSYIKHFVETVNGIHPLTISAKRSI